MRADQQPILVGKHISKTFPGVRALDDVNFELFPGEIHGLVGENGAGKSTLIKIFSGVYSYDEPARGQPGDESGLFLQGKKVVFRNPGRAIKHKIMTIHQELNVIPDLTVYDNIFLNNELVKNIFLRRKEMKIKADEILNTFGVDFASTDIVKGLSADKQKLVEVLKAILQDTKILIMDEPTSTLTDAEAKHLFQVMQNVAHQGIAIIFISHNLGEIVDLCDNITVLKDGKMVRTLKNNNVKIDDIISLMVGVDLKETIYNQQFTSHKTDKELLRVENFNYKNKVRNVSFCLNKGEIVGITSLVGAGGTDLAKTIFGVEGYKKSSGTIFIEKKKVDIKNTGDAINHRIAFLTEDRKREGLFLQFKLFENVTIPSLHKFMTNIGILNEKERRKVTDNYIDSLHIKASNSGVITESLSGGNQQKAVIAKWLETDPNILILAEPTVGIDVAAKAEIRRSITNLAAQGKGIILITSEFVELKELCDRVFVMFNGEIIVELCGEEIQEDAILKYSLGGKS
jgi:ribose transport system ATP-binding protein